MPTVAIWPKHVKAGTVVNTPSMLSDWPATMADVAHLPAPARFDGVSLLPLLTGAGKQEKGLVYVEYYEGGRTPTFKEFEASRRGKLRKQMQAIRMDSLVGVRYDIQSCADDFEIYNVLTDPKETTNLAKIPGYKAIQIAMKDKVLQVRHPDAEAPRPYDNDAIPAITDVKNIVQGLSWQYYRGTFQWVAKPGSLVANQTGISTDVYVKNNSGLTIYKGYVRIPADGRYTFTLLTGGKAYVRLHEAALIDADFGYQPGETRTQSVNLKAGMHPVLIYFCPGVSGPGLKFSCTAKDGTEVFKPDNLYH